MNIKDRRKEKLERKTLALVEIKKLFAEAQHALQERADACVKIAQHKAQRENIRLPREYKRRYCKHCNTHLKTGTNARIRTREGKLIIYCFGCKKYTKQEFRINGEVRGKK